MDAVTTRWWVVVGCCLVFAPLLHGQSTTATEDPFGELRELTKDISPKARQAINELISVDQSSDSAKRGKLLRRVMERLEPSTVQELFDLYQRSAPTEDNN